MMRMLGDVSELRMVVGLLGPFAECRILSFDWDSDNIPSLKRPQSKSIAMKTRLHCLFPQCWYRPASSWRRNRDLRRLGVQTTFSAMPSAYLKATTPACSAGWSALSPRMNKPSHGFASADSAFIPEDNNLVIIHQCPTTNSTPPRNH